MTRGGNETARAAARESHDGAPRPIEVQPVDVHVTIGHIEVRTAAPPTPVPRTARPRPGVSLDDYLRRRSGGSR
jgi:hypothetical protein